MHCSLWRRVILQRFSHRICVGRNNLELILILIQFWFQFRFLFWLWFKFQFPFWYQFWIWFRYSTNVSIRKNWRLFWLEFRSDGRKVHIYQQTRCRQNSSEFLPQKKQMIAEFLLEKKQNSPGWKISVKNLNTPDILNCVTNKTEPIIRKHTYIKNPHCGMHVQNCCLCATK